MTDLPAVSLRNVWVRYDSREILRGVSLTVRRGEVLALFGASGGGKTTLLRTVNYLTPFDSGRIEVLGRVLHPGMSERKHARELSALRRQVGMVFQHFSLFPHLTVLENLVEAPQHVLGWTAVEARRCAEQWLERLELSHLRDVRPRTLSGGEQQRACLARALVMQPQVLLLDEPTSALDASRQGLVRDVVREFAMGGGAVLLVTHQPEFAHSLAERSLLLHDGRIVLEGRTEDVLAKTRQELQPTHE